MDDLVQQQVVRQRVGVELDRLVVIFSVALEARDVDEPLEVLWVVVQVARGDERARGLDEVDRAATARGRAVGLGTLAEDRDGGFEVLEVEFADGMPPGLRPSADASASPVVRAGATR